MEFYLFRIYYFFYLFNLIDKKLKDLVVKNKHLEQIRFVLEHRMTSLEKEKSPLEGQCSFLENQKNKLTEEFNKIITDRFLGERGLYHFIFLTSNTKYFYDFGIYKRCRFCYNKFMEKISI